MHKLTLEQALSLLKALGAPVVEIVSDPAAASPEFNADEAVRSVDTARKPIIRSQIEDEVRDTIAKSASGRTAGTFKSALAREFGVTRDELDKFDSGKEGDMVKALMAKWTEANPSKDADAESLRQQMQSLADAHKTALDAQKASYEAKISEVNAKFIGRDIDELLAGHIKAIPRVGGDESAQAKMLRAHLEGLYHLEYNPATKKVELRDKEKHERIVMNEAGTQILSVDQVAKSFLENLGVAAKDTSKITPTSVMAGAAGAHVGAGAVQVGPNGMFTPASQDPLDVANARMAQELGIGS